MIYVLTISNLKKAQQCIYVFALILLSGKSFHKILFWLETFHTDPSMLEIITVFLHGENLVLDHECPKSLKPMCNNLREIGLHQMWLGFLPIGMVECQKSCYQQIGSRNSLKKQGLDLVQKMLREIHGLWMEINNIMHLCAANYTRAPNDIALQTAVSQ